VYKEQVITTVYSEDSFRCPCNLCAGAAPPRDNSLRLAPAEPANDEAMRPSPNRMPIRRIPRLAAACLNTLRP
jgi:hypothetical protein